MLSQSSEFTLLVAAAGAGERLAMGPKAFLRLGHKSLLQWVVSQGHACVHTTFVAVPPGAVTQAEVQLAEFPEVHIVEGGHSRQDTYRILLEKCRTEFVVIRDVARPLASTALIEKVMAAALAHGAAGAFQRLDTPVAIKEGNVVTAALTADKVLMPSNPQAYQLAILNKAISRASQQNIEKQTLWELVIRDGNALHIVDGETENLKVTTQQDWDFLSRVVFPRWLETQTP